MLPTQIQTMHFQEQILHGFALFDPPKMGPI